MTSPGARESTCALTHCASRGMPMPTKTTSGRAPLSSSSTGVQSDRNPSLVYTHRARCVYTSDGFRSDWTPVLEELKGARPDVVFVGMGMPREAQWVSAHVDSLAPGLVMTCGGWFGFLAGEESRAPAIVQRHGIEWVWRLVQSPRLLSRYTRGTLTTARLFLTALLASPRRAARS